MWVVVVGGETRLSDDKDAVEDEEDVGSEHESSKRWDRGGGWCRWSCQTPVEGGVEDGGGGTIAWASNGDGQ